ncbi:MAG: hypothetical protein ACREJB_03575 [Planctomycetaceae bacterium]
MKPLIRPSRRPTAMLHIETRPLPQTSLSYLAFRVAFHETLERLTLARQMGEEDGCFGYLTEAPFLRGVPPQVQLDVLADTWSRHTARERFAATVIDEAVIYAACETAAFLAEEEPAGLRGFLRGGPLKVHLQPGPFLAAELRSLHLNLPGDGDFLLLTQFEDLPPREARRMKRHFGLKRSRCEPLFDLLGRWHVAPGLSERLIGLLTPREIARASDLVGVRRVSNSE